MGNSESKESFRKAIVDLSQKSKPVDASDDSYWSQFWSENATDIQDIFSLTPANELRSLRDEMPSNLATLCYKAVKRIDDGAKSLCGEPKEHQTVINCVRLLTRILPYLFEDNDWKGFFWSKSSKDGEKILAVSLLDSLSDLLFCPGFTVNKRQALPESASDSSFAVDSCEYIWEAGVGCVHSPGINATFEKNRCDILQLLLVCFSSAMYSTSEELSGFTNKWVGHIASAENRHALPLFTSLLNVSFAYDPVGYGVPYNHLLVSDHRRPSVELALQILCVCVETEGNPENNSTEGKENLFTSYLARIHREEDFAFILKGLMTLLNNPLRQSYLPAAASKIEFTQELLILFWKLCDINKKFMFYVLKSSDVLDVVVPVLFYLNEARHDQARVGLIHISVFIILLLSGERNFGVRLNKPFTSNAPPGIPVFSGTHADLLITVFHKVITNGHPKLQPLYDCLLTIIVNISPYLKTLSMVASAKLMYLAEIFCHPSFLFSQPGHHHLAFFLLEIFNNIIQYQFDGNCNLIYQIIRKRNIFYQLANISSDQFINSRYLPKAPFSEEHPAESTKPAVATTSQQPVPTTQVTSSGAAAATAVKSTEAPKGEQGDVSQPNTPGPMSGGGDASPTTSANQESSNKEGVTPKSPLAKSFGTSLAEVPSIAEMTGNQGASPSEDTTKPTDSAPDKKGPWAVTPDWVNSWKQKLPLQTIMRLLQVLVPQVEKICIDKGLTDETEILKFLQNGTLVGLLPVPHPILIRKYQANEGTVLWFQTYMWGVLYLRHTNPPIWFNTNVKLFEVQKM